MSEEQVSFNCILPTPEMSFYTSIDTVESVMREVLRVKSIKLGCYIPQFLTTLKEKLQTNSEIQHGLKYNISHHNSKIFEILDEPIFWRDLRNVKINVVGKWL